MNIINPSIYDDSTSLVQNISTLTDKKTPVTNKALINLVSKYFFAYAYPESMDQNVSLEDINTVFSWAEKCCKASKEGGIIDVTSDVSIEELMFYQTFYESGYGLSMLGDIASSATIIKNIVKRTIDPKDFDGKYVGLDLGTGTGILLLAQYIQALRNDYKSIKNIGIDIDTHTVENSSHIVNKLGIGSVLQGDTTKVEIYDTLNITGPVTFISNENIPTTGVKMNGVNDPFHQNNRMLYQTPMKDKLCTYTQTFPYEIAMTLQIGSNFKRTIVGSHENGFSSKFLIDFEKSVKESEGSPVPENWNVLDHVFVEGIALDGTFMPVHEIGSPLIGNGSVTHLPNRRHRWSDKAVRLQQENKL